MKAISKTRIAAVVAVAVVMVVCWAGTVMAQDIASVPFIVNVNAAVNAKRGAESYQKNVTANTQDTLKILISETGTSILQRTQNAQTGASAITSSRGRVTINLPAQSYNTAEISLYSVNGRRILRNVVSSSQTSNGISRPNLTAGVYLLSVNGVGGNSFSSRITHGGGGMNINVAFGSAKAISDKQAAAALFKQAADNAGEEWTITVSAQWYADSSYTLNIAAGENPPQVITLSSSGVYDFRTVVIGGMTWMAENLNVNTANSWCYNNDNTNCAKYGRLYTWDVAMSACEGLGDGWRLPDNSDWDALVAAVGGNPGAGTKLKSKSPDWDGTDDYGFSALPGGDILTNSAGGVFTVAGKSGFWWSATESSSSVAYDRRMHTDDGNVQENSYYKDDGISVRCVR